ncbi:MAG: hypothetical protein QM656_03385 [Paracoccaceae bacterium]
MNDAVAKDRLPDAITRLQKYLAARDARSAQRAAMGLGADLIMIMPSAEGPAELLGEDIRAVLLALIAAQPAPVEAVPVAWDVDWRGEIAPGFKTAPGGSALYRKKQAADDHCEKLRSLGYHVTVTPHYAHPPADAEIARLTAEVERLTEQRDKAIAGWEASQDKYIAAADRIEGYSTGISMARHRLEMMADDMAAGRCDGGLLAARHLKRAIPGIFADAAEALAAQAGAVNPRFLPGADVVVSSSYENAGEWVGVNLVVVSIDLGPDLTTHKYTVAEGIQRGHWSGLSDGWGEADLSPAPAAALDRAPQEGGAA